METNYYVTSNTEGIFRVNGTDDVEKFESFPEAMATVYKYLRYYLPKNECLHVLFQKDIKEGQVMTFDFPEGPDNDVRSSAFTEEIVVEIYKEVTGRYMCVHCEKEYNRMETVCDCKTKRIVQLENPLYLELEAVLTELSVDQLIVLRKCILEYPDETEHLVEMMQHGKPEWMEKL